MKVLKNIFPFFIALLVTPALLLAQSNSTSIEQRADSLYQNYYEEQALELYSQILEQEPDNFKALWRSSFLYSRIGNRFDDEDKQKKYFNKAIDLAKRALAVDSTNTHSNFVMSVAMGRKALISGASERVAAARDIKKYVDRALKYDSTNAGAWHVLGRWHFKIANLSWIESVAADALFGGVPKGASNEKAAKAIEKAIDLHDDYLLYYYDLARVYDEMGQEQKTISLCKTALSKPSVSPDDDEIKQNCRELIEDVQ
ncbi:MAG TPA: hypothetical protein VFG39_04990 [Balneolaceae bacterium]|nr:hypothetical protein [Balneolaceae bacterium]